MRPSKCRIFAGANLLRLCAAQSDIGSLWSDNQLNATWCQWSLPRTAVLHDTLYIDGGQLVVYPGLKNGSYGYPIDNGNPRGLVYMLNFSTPFNISSNFTEVMTSMTKAGTGLANNIAPNFYDGAMLANNEEWFTYGGEVVLTDAFSPPDADWVAKYMRYLSGPERVFEPGWQVGELSANITRYVSAGAAASVPSEKLGFYFGGLRDPNYGAIEFLPGTVNTLSMSMIEVDTNTYPKETWRNISIPASIGGRANAELVWVPVGGKGLLVAIGGVVNPSFATAGLRLNVSETDESKRISPGFMSTVAIYDIQSGQWYEQETSGTIPPQLTQGCTVVASAQDSSSHNIYWYGGYDGITLTSSDNFVDDVWVLSVPSFTWTKVKSGSFGHARARHRCVKPYPDQMFVVGGYIAPVGATIKCVDQGLVQIFNLSSAEWIRSYDPNTWSEYTVPSTVIDKIGGSGRGGATVLAPSKGWSNSTLGTLFGTKYDTTKIKKFYPYAKAQATSVPTLIPAPPPSGGSSTPGYLAPVLGVVLGLFFITLIVLAILLWRRRKFLRSRNGTVSESGTIENSRWIDQWLRGTPPTSPIEPKAPTVTTDETPPSHEDDAQVFVPPVGVYEAGGGQVHELGDTSTPSELHGMGFTPLYDKNKSGLRPSPSVGSHTSQTSTVSHVSSLPPSRPGASPLPSPDYSPTHSHSGPPSPDETRRVVSDMSAVSEMERGHLRGISETSVSTIGDYVTPLNLPARSPGSPYGPDSYTQVAERERSMGSLPKVNDNDEREQGGEEHVITRADGGRPSLVSPMTPPGGDDAQDYIGGDGRATGEQGGLSSGLGSMRSTRSISGGGKRKSNFQEGF